MLEVTSSKNNLYAHWKENSIGHLILQLPQNNMAFKELTESVFSVVFFLSLFSPFFLKLSALLAI